VGLKHDGSVGEKVIQTGGEVNGKLCRTEIPACPCSVKMG
jgi:hypothetical protein